jgi:two-component system sensor histidine kinase CpxA
LVRLDETEWPEALEQAVGGWRARGLRVAVTHNSGTVITGDTMKLPTEVQTAIQNHNAKMGWPIKGPRGPVGGKAGPFRGQPEPDGPGGSPRAKPPNDGFPSLHPPEPPDNGLFPKPDDRIRNNLRFRPPNGDPEITAATKEFEKFMLVSANPRTYWAGIHLDNSAGPLPYTLILASDSIRGGGLFFDYVPWLWLGTALAVMSLLLWLPMVHILTSTLQRLTTSAENIAAGSFIAPPGTRRCDELGRLQNAHRHMAQRLDGFVTGQKRFLGDTAHELLSPLARLEVALCILEQRTYQSDSITVERALAEVRRMASLVQDLLTFSRSALVRKEETLEPVTLANTVQEAVSQEGAESFIEIHIANDLAVMAVPRLLSRAIENIIRNAVRYAAADGPILISADRDYAKVILTVSDAGPGAPEDTLPKLFDPFYRPDNSRTTVTGGTGLGLAIVKSCIEACKGDVSASNRVPTGFVVTIALQAAE